MHNRNKIYQIFYDIYKIIYLKKWHEYKYVFTRRKLTNSPCQQFPLSNNHTTERDEKHDVTQLFFVLSTKMCVKLTVDCCFCWKKRLPLDIWLVMLLLLFEIKGVSWNLIFVYSWLLSYAINVGVCLFRNKLYSFWNSLFQFKKLHIQHIL